MDDGRVVCLYSNVAAEFDHAYFTLIHSQVERLGINAVPGASLCLARWAKIAGHPNPREFE